MYWFADWFLPSKTYKMPIDFKIIFFNILDWFELFFSKSIDWLESIFDAQGIPKVLSLIIQAFVLQLPLTSTTMTMQQMRWRCKWDDNYWTGTQEGERKKEKEKERTPTPTHLAWNGQTLKGQGKRKSGRTTGQKITRRGERTEAPDTTYKARAKAYLGTRRT